MNPWAVLLLVYLFGLHYAAGLITPELRRIASGDLIAHMPRRVLWFTVGVSLLAWPYGLWRYFNGIRDPIMDKLIDQPVRPVMYDDDDFDDDFDDLPAALPPVELPPTPELVVDCPSCKTSTKHTLVWRCDSCKTVYDNNGDEVSP